MPGTPGKSAGNGTEIRQDIVRFYKDSGLEPVAKEVMCVCVCFGITNYILKNHHNYTFFSSLLKQTGQTQQIGRQISCSTRTCDLLQIELKRFIEISILFNTYVRFNFRFTASIFGSIHYLKSVWLITFGSAYLIRQYSCTREKTWRQYSTDRNEGSDRDVSVVTDINNNGSQKPAKLKNPPAFYRSAKSGRYAYFLPNKMICI